MKRSQKKDLAGSEGRPARKGPRMPGGQGGMRMEFGREKLKQIRHLMLLAALLVLGIIYSQQVFWGVGFLVIKCKIK